MRSCAFVFLVLYLATVFARGQQESCTTPIVDDSVEEQGDVLLQTQHRRESSRTAPDAVDPDTDEIDVHTHGRPPIQDLPAPPHPFGLLAGADEPDTEVRGRARAETITESINRGENQTLDNQTLRAELAGHEIKVDTDNQTLGKALQQFPRPPHPFGLLAAGDGPDNNDPGMDNADDHTHGRPPLEDLPPPPHPFGLLAVSDDPDSNDPGMDDTDNHTHGRPPLENLPPPPHPFGLLAVSDDPDNDDPGMDDNDNHTHGRPPLENLPPPPHPFGLLNADD